MSGRSSVVESLLPKQVVRGSNPLARSKYFPLLASPFSLIARSMSLFQSRFQSFLFP